MCAKTIAGSLANITPCCAFNFSANFLRKNLEAPRMRHAVVDNLGGHEAEASPGC